MIDDKRLLELIEVYSNTEAGRAFQEFLDLREQNKEFADREDDYAMLLGSANSDVKRLEKYVDKLQQQNKELIEDAEYWFTSADPYYIENVPAVMKKAKQHNALMEKYK